MGCVIVTDYHPHAKISEGSCNLLDFIACLQDKVTIQYTYEAVAEGILEEDLAIICLFDDTSPIVLKKLLLQSRAKKNVIFTPTMRYEPSQSLACTIGLELEDDMELFLVTHNTNWIDATIPRVIYTNCIHDAYLQPLDPETTRGASLVVLDVLDNPQNIYSSSCMNEVLPYLNAQRSRSIEKKPPMIIVSNIGVSSLRVSPESLASNGLIVKGICWDKARPEVEVRLAKELIYPAIKSKAFGRWAYIASQFDIPVKTDAIHGFQLYNNSKTQTYTIKEAIEKINDWQFRNR